jgi:hypothetical protein
LLPDVVAAAELGGLLGGGRDFFSGGPRVLVEDGAQRSAGLCLESHVLQRLLSWDVSSDADVRIRDTS